MFDCRLSGHRHSHVTKTRGTRLFASVLAPAWILIMLAGAAAAQSVSINNTPSADPNAAALDVNPDAGGVGGTQTVPAPNNQVSPQAYQDVYVDGEKHSWKPLETGTQQAWEAYRNGDYSAAVPVFARLAKLGHPVAEWLMGNLYFSGQGVPLDYQQALRWFEKAADQGYMPAYAPTAKLYEQGKGSEIDLGKAYLWYNVAIAVLPYSIERYGLMKQRDAIAALMTPAQIAAAQKKSLAFQPRKVVPPDLEQARQILGE